MNKIFFFSAKKYEIKYFNLINKKYFFKIKYIKESINIDNIYKVKNYNHICVFVNDDLKSSEIIYKLKEFNIKTIALRCAGYDNVNLELAKKLNIKIVNVKSYSPESIAEYTLGLMLNLTRKIYKSYQYTKNQNFELNNLIGYNLKNKTIGIIGTGKIGINVIKLLKNFNTNILAFDIIKNKKIYKYNAKYTSLDNIYKKSDIISLHCPYNNSTHYIINKNSIKKMKKGVIIINTSRGELLNTKEIIKYIIKKKIGALGIDVYENEKKYFFKNKSNKIIKDNNLNLLLSYHNVLLTGHQAFLTHESLKNIAKITLKNIKKILSNEKCENII